MRFQSETTHYAGRWAGSGDERVDVRLSASCLLPPAERSRSAPLVGGRHQEIGPTLSAAARSHSLLLALQIYGTYI